MRPQDWDDAMADSEAGKHGVRMASLDAADSASLNAAADLDELSREVYCILGLPIDAIEIPTVLYKIRDAAASRTPFVISTPNLNFLVTSLKDDEFRESLLLSDLCPADGMPIVWIARLMGLPIKDRTAGSDVFAALRAEPRCEQPLKVFLFGTTENTAAAAARMLNAGTTAIHCVGWICPGFGTVEELGQDQHIDQINSSGADFLVAALGAKKGQLWLLRNHTRLRVPVRAQLGATINYQVGTVKRSPLALQKVGLEWLWRIWQEPQLWSRYRDDGIVFLRLLATHVMPLALKARTLRRTAQRIPVDLVVDSIQTHDCIIIRLRGFAIACHAQRAAASFRQALVLNRPIEIDLSVTSELDARFLGLFLMVRKRLKTVGGTALRFSGVTPKMETLFHRNGLDYLLRESRESAPPNQSNEAQSAFAESAAN
ncbi:MAG: WecB/TagA/CpsF family glycosyltransferase [Candidatus Binataceae bacterium]|jgi:N-acetylglucosaminyldiphosphoundecaprenol N-acetyl-beta-D-mannosaminyltransferase